MQDPVRLFDQYRDVAILLWVLGEDAGYDVKDPWYVRGLDWLKEMFNPSPKPKSLPLSKDELEDMYKSVPEDVDKLFRGRGIKGIRDYPRERQD